MNNVATRECNRTTRKVRVRNKERTPRETETERERERESSKTKSVRRERNDNMIAQKGGRWPRRSNPKGGRTKRFYC
jgi:hypothetical protein